MGIKTRTHVNAQSADKLADELADKPYGQQQSASDDERLVRTSLSLPATMQARLEDLAIQNKRAGRDLRTVSAIVRQAIEQYFISNNS